MKILIQILSIVLFLGICCPPALRANEVICAPLDKLKQNYRNAIINKYPDTELLIKALSEIPPEKEVSDQSIIELQQRYPISSDEVTFLVQTLDSNGSWADIDYKDGKRSGWEPKKHAERILKLTKYYYQHKETLPPAELAMIKGSIHKAMGYWFDSRLVCKNWWYNEIGIPRTLGPAFLLFENEMNEQERQAAVKVMLNAKFGMTGQNKVWLAGNVLIRALLENDWALVKVAQAEISSEIVLGRDEGIKADWSFHQHGPQQQFGNYGLAYIANMGFYSEVFAGTPLAFPQEKQKILTSLLLEGFQWIVWRGYWDVNALNRQLFRNADIDKTFYLSFAASALLKGSDPATSTEIREMIERNSLQGTVANSFIGHKHFGESDYTVHRTPRWMASLRMASYRVIGTELINEDNLKGYYMADGALYTYIRGDEYHNIFPYWDWRRIPGITTYESNASIPDPRRCDPRNRSSLVGGTSRGNCGVTAMELRRNGLNAHKAWVFTDKFVLCLGGDIHSDSSATVMTTVDQRFGRGKVWSADGKRFFHDNTGYIILQADTCVAVTERNQGQWHDFMGMYKPEIVEDDIFSICIKHRKDKPASYAYLILPGSSQTQTRDFATDAISILRNDGEMQAVIIGKHCYAVAYKETSISIPGFKEPRVLIPGTYIIDLESGALNGDPFIMKKES